MHVRYYRYHASTRRQLKRRILQFQAGSGFFTAIAEAAAYLVDDIIPRVAVQQWVLSFPIPLHSLLAIYPEWLAAVLQIIQRVITTFLIQQTGLKCRDAATGAITLIQRSGLAANLNIHLHGLVLDGLYCITGEGAPCSFLYLTLK